jgi:iron complex outermembrane recepter protein
MLSKRLSIDVAAYFNAWDNVQSTELSGSFFETTPTPPHEVQTLLYENLIHGESHGIEITANWKVRDWWSINPGFAFAREHFHTDPQSADTQTTHFLEGNSPGFPIYLRSHVALRRNLAWDVSAYFDDALENQGPLSDLTIRSYTRLDTGLTWKLGERLSLSVVGQNLLKDHHMEFQDVNGSMQSGLIKRSAYAKVTWQF